MKISDKTIENLTYEQIEIIARAHFGHLIAISKNKDELLINIAGFWSEFVDLLRKAN